MYSRLLLTAAAVLSLAGCVESEPFGFVGCTEEARPPVILKVKDARTGAAAANGATGTITEDLYSDALTVANDSLMVPRRTVEREGVYDVTVSKPGYRAWTATGVKVVKDECHVKTAALDVRLEPAQ